MLGMGKASENSAVIEVLNRWMPALRQEALDSGQAEDTLLEQVLTRALPRTEAADFARMAEEADASGYEEVDDLDAWHADLEQEVRSSIA